MRFKLKKILYIYTCVFILKIRYSADLKIILSQLLAKKPADRITIDRVLANPYVIKYISDNVSYTIEKQDNKFSNTINCNQKMPNNIKIDSKNSKIEFPSLHRLETKAKTEGK